VVGVDVVHRRVFSPGVLKHPFCGSLTATKRAEHDTLVGFTEVRARLDPSLEEPPGALPSDGPDASEIDTYLNSTGSDFPWQWIYLALAASSTVLLALAVGQVFWFGALPEAAVAAFIVVAFVVTALAHAYDRRRQEGSIPSELRE